MRFSWRSAFDIFTSMIILFLAGWLVYLHVQTRQLLSRPAAESAISIPNRPLSIADSPTKGAETAPLVLVEFADFECPYCARFAQEILPRIELEYVATGKLRVVFKHFPLKTHQMAELAAEYSECAREQNLFWQTHDIVFAKHPARLDEQFLQAAVAEAGIGRGFLNGCIAGRDALKKKIEEDALLAAAIHIGGTPAFLLGTPIGRDRVRVVRAVSGARPFQVFKDAFDSASAHH